MISKLNIRFVVLASCLAGGALLVSGCNMLGMKSAHDQQITKAVTERIQSDPQLQGLTINVATQNGVVTLSGTGASAAQRIQAENDANVPGVQSVSDQLPTLAAAATPPPAATEPTPAPAPAESAAPAPAKRHTAHHHAPSETVDTSSSSANTAGGGASTSNPAPEPAATRRAVAPPVIVASGTVIPVRLEQALSSDSVQPGQAFVADLAQPVTVNGQTAIPKGAKVKGVVVAAASAGHFEGRSELSLRLTSVSYNGQSYDVSAQDLMKYGPSRGQRTAKVVGGGAVGGALLGALFGGKKGAAIGAAVGSGAGAAAQQGTKPAQVVYPAETVLNFTLSQNLSVTPSSAVLQ
jgi:hypothetical protein